MWLMRLTSAYSWLPSFQDRAKVQFTVFFLRFVELSDALSLLGHTQSIRHEVSPVEIENTLLAHLDGLIIDATVAGVSDGRTSGEKIPRAWIVLSEAGKRKGEAAVAKALDEWVKENLSRYKRLSGGIEVVNEVCWGHSFPILPYDIRTVLLVQIPKLPTGKVLRRVLQDEYDQRMNKLADAKIMSGIHRTTYLGRHSIIRLCCLASGCVLYVSWYV
jgi:hypothetical protein